jgi:hypothetical protein
LCEYDVRGAFAPTERPFGRSTAKSETRHPFSRKNGRLSSNVMAFYRIDEVGL